MLAHAKKSLTQCNNVEFVLLKHPELTHLNESSMDFVYAFDVFPHIDLHTIWKYIKEIKKVLKIGGKALIHTANIIAPQGWERFCNQTKYTAGGFYFMSPDIVHQLVEKAEGLKIIKKSSYEENSPCMYYMRDYIIVIERIE